MGEIKVTTSKKCTLSHFKIAEVFSVINKIIDLKTKVKFILKTLN